MPRDDSCKIEFARDFRAFFRPTILLPDISDEREKQLALAHEWAHFENGDLTALAVERVVMFLLCLHPMFWCLRAHVRGDQEILADLKAAERSDRTHYAEQLLVWAKRAVQQPVFAETSMLGIVEFSGKKSPQRKTLLTRRITMLLDENVRLTKISRMGKFVTLLVAVVITVLFSMQTLRPQAHLAVANVTEEQTAIEEKTQESPKKQAFLRPEKSDSLYFRWNALLDYGFNGTRVSYDPKMVIDLYKQKGMDSVKDYIKGNNPPKFFEASLRSAVWTICHSLMGEKKYDELVAVMQVLPEGDRKFHSLFAGVFYTGDIEKSYETYRQLAGENASMNDFVDAALNIYKIENGFDVLATLRSLDHAEMRAGLAASILERVSNPWKRTDPLKESAIDLTELSQLFLDDSAHIQDTKLKLAGIQAALNILTKAEKTEVNAESFRETMQACVDDYFKNMMANDELPQRLFGEKNVFELALEAGMIDTVVEHIMASPSLQQRNASLQNVMSHLGSTDKNWKGDISTWGSLDNLMAITYIEPIRSVKSAYARMLITDHEMTRQLEWPGAMCVAFCDEIRKPEYLEAARAADDAFVKGESLAVIAASNALAKNSDQARTLVDEAIEQLANIEDATRQNYLKTQIARVYAFLKDADKFREWDAEIRGGINAKNNRDTLSQLQFYAAFAGLKELSDEIFVQHLAAVTEGVPIPDDPYHYQQMTEEQKAYQAACQELDALFYKADGTRDKERMFAVFETMEAFEVSYRDNHFGRLYKIDPEFAMQKMKERAIALGQNRIRSTPINGYTFFVQNLEQYIPKRVVAEVFQVYLDSVAIEKPIHFHSFLGVIGANFGSGNTLFEKYSVDLSRAKPIFEAAEKVLPDDGDSNMISLHEFEKIFFIAKCYHEFGETQRAIELLEGMLDHLTMIFEKGRIHENFPYDPIIQASLQYCVDRFFQWNVSETNPELLEKSFQLFKQFNEQTKNIPRTPASATFHAPGGAPRFTTEDFDVNPDGSVDINVNLNDTGNRYDTYKKAVQLVLDTGENATDEQIRACIDLIVDENDIIEMGDPMKDQAPFVNVLTTHKNPENLKYLVELLMKTFEKCRETQNGNGQLQAGANLCIVLTIIELHDIEDEYYTSLDAKLRESLPEDMRMMFRFMGCCMAKRFDLAQEMAKTFPEEMQAMAQDALEDWSQDAESKEDFAGEKK